MGRGEYIRASSWTGTADTTAVLMSVMATAAEMVVREWNMKMR